MRGTTSNISDWTGLPAFDCIWAFLNHRLRYGTHLPLVAKNINWITTPRRRIYENLFRGEW
jgi:hypothetical protein